MRWIGLAATLMLLSSGIARAEETPKLAPLPRAASLPDLLHPWTELSFEQTTASLSPHGYSGQRTAILYHLDLEIPVVRRFLWIGASYGLAAAQSPTESKRFVPGEPQVYARVVHVEPNDKYTLGAGLGIVAPLIKQDDHDDGQRLTQDTPSAIVAVLRPWDLASFLDRRVTLRPWFDVRIGRGNWIAQFRQGIDIAIRSSAIGLADHAGETELLSISTVYLGWQPTRAIALGLEAWEVYFLSTHLPITDRDRTAFAIAPGFRFFHPRLEPGISLFLPVGSTILGAVDSYWGLRLDVRVPLGG